MSEVATYKFPPFLYIGNPDTCISLYEVTRNIIPINTVRCSTTECIDFDFEKMENATQAKFSFEVGKKCL